MPHPFLVELRQALHGGRQEKEALPALIERFVQMPFFAPASNSDDVPQGRKALLLVGKSEDDRDLRVALDAATAEARVKPANGSILEIDGATMLKMVQRAPFRVSIVDDGDGLVLEYQVLLLFVQLLAIERSDGNASAIDAAAVAKQYPTAFARWLYDYCREQPDIAQAWLGLVSLAGKTTLDVGVALDGGASPSHHERIRAQTGLLLPGQFLHLDLRGDQQDFDLLRPLTDEAPFYSRSHSQGWWARLHRRLRPAPITCLDVNITPDADRPA